MNSDEAFRRSRHVIEAPDPFDKFAQDVENDPLMVLLARWRRSAFISALKDRPAVAEVIPSGSLAHGTRLGPVHDVDLVVVFDESMYPDWGGGGSAQAALEHLRAAIRETLQAEPERPFGLVHDTELRNHVVRCDLDPSLGPLDAVIRDTSPVDVMPAIRQGSHLRVPERHSDRWIDVDPERLMMMVAARQRAWSNFDEVVRMIKDWADYQGLEMTSLAVEVLVLTYLPRLSLFETMSCSDAVAGFFEAASRARITRLADPAGHCGEIDPHMDYAALRKALDNSAELARRAVDAERAWESRHVTHDGVTHPSVFWLEIFGRGRFKRPRVWYWHPQFPAQQPSPKARHWFDEHAEPADESAWSWRPWAEATESVPDVHEPASLESILSSSTQENLARVAALLDAEPIDRERISNMSEASARVWVYEVATRIARELGVAPPQAAALVTDLLEMARNSSLAFATESRQSYQKPRRIRPYGNAPDAASVPYPLRENPGATDSSARGGGGKSRGENYSSGDGSGRRGRGEGAEAGQPPIRYLTGNLPERAPTGRRISLLVLISLASSGSSSALLKPIDVPPEGCGVTITVSAPALIPMGDLEQDLHVPAAADSEPIRFGFVTGRVGLHVVTVRAFSAGTFLGELSLEVSVEAVASLEEGPSRSAVLGGLAAEPGEVTLQVSRTDEDRYSFQLIGEALYPVELTGRLAGDPTEVVSALVDELRAMAAKESSFSTPELVRNRLRNLGAQLWADVVPEAIRRQFWAQADRIKLFTVASDMDAVPWELLYPVDGNNDNGFLVEQFPVVRRVYGQGRVRHLQLSSAAYIVPPGSPGNAMDEVQVVRDQLGGDVSDQGVHERLDSLIALLEDSPSVLHFACHNGSRTRTARSSAWKAGPYGPAILQWPCKGTAWLPQALWCSSTLAALRGRSPGSCR